MRPGVIGVIFGRGSGIISCGVLSVLTNLVSYWKLDESSGNATDTIGSNTLTNTNTVTYSAGKVNNGATMVSASSQELKITDGSQVGLDITGNLTIAYWFKRSSGSKVHVGKYNSTGGQKSYLLQVYSDNNIYFDISGTGVNDIYFTSTATTTDTGWNHLVGVYNGSTLVVYLNGSLLAGSTTGVVPASLADSASDFSIGKYDANYSDAQYDEVGIWSKALTSEEVTSVYTTGC